MLPLFFIVVVKYSYELISIVLNQSACSNATGNFYISTSLTSYRLSRYISFYYFFISLFLYLYLFDGVVIAVQCTAIFSDLLCSPEFSYY